MSHEAPWWRTAPFEVVYMPSPREAQAGDLFVGVGTIEFEASGTTVCLNHKAAARGGKPDDRCASVSEYVFKASDDMVRNWRQRFPDGIVGVRRVVVEDASLDTCFALLLFACRIAPEPMPRVPSLGAVGDETRIDPRNDIIAWIDYVNSWESGRVVDAASIETSPACLLSVLSHSYLAVDDAGMGRRPDNSTIRAALVASLDLLDGVLAVRRRPEMVGLPQGLAELARAQHQLRFELHRYASIVASGIRTQLSIPISNSRRRMFVDALFFEDEDTTGLLKIFARADKTNSWTHQGFAVTGIYREALAGTGYDMTISVDPSTGLSLADLWVRLEELEDIKWGDDRPRDRPRIGIAKYTSENKAIAGAPNEPWYDDMGRYTLLAAPREVSSGTPGSRLGWFEDVLPAIWDIYKPALFLQPIDRRSMGGGRSLAIVRHQAADRATLTCAPSVRSYLATLSAEYEARHPGEFVSESELSVIPFAGGEVILHRSGATVVRDLGHSPTSEAKVIATIEAMAKVANGYSELLKGSAIIDLVKNSTGLMRAPRRHGLKRANQLRTQVIGLRCRLLELAGTESTTAPSQQEATLRAAIERAWEMPVARQQLMSQLVDLDGGLREAQSTLFEDRQFITASVLSAAALYFVIRDAMGVARDKMMTNAYEVVRVATSNLGQSCPADSSAGTIGATATVHAPMNENAMHIIEKNAALQRYFDEAAVWALGAVFVFAATAAAKRYFGARRKTTD